MSSAPLDTIKQFCELSPDGRPKYHAALHYRDLLGWIVHPLKGPKAGGEGAGKGPLAKNWPKLKLESVTDKKLEADFGNGGDANVGVVVRRPYVCVDLDSKKDQGNSAREWVAANPALAQVPREKTGGGLHLHFRCPDLPEITKNGKPYQRALVSQLSPEVTAELYHDGLNLVVSPSIHPNGTRYAWEVAGDIPEVTWKQLQEWFGFELPDGHQPTGKDGQNDQWWKQHRGDFRSLDLGGVFQEFNMLGKVVDADKGAIAVKCPWRAEHSDGKQPWDGKDSSTVIFSLEDNERWPGFKCHHAHCADRGLKDVLQFFERHKPGVVDEHCARTWVWEPGQKSEGGLPRVLLPREGRTDSAFATDIGKLLAETKAWFVRGDDVVTPATKQLSESITCFGFQVIPPIVACTAIEKHIETGKLIEIDGSELFSATSMSKQMAEKLINAPQLKERLPKVSRIFRIPIPVFHNVEIVFPSGGYDERFLSYCDPNAPKIHPMPLDQAITILQTAYSGFCFKDDYSRCIALARLITPFCRGLMGFESRPPLWLFEANRPRAGKDYIAGVTMLVYEDYACEDAPLDPMHPEETRKRITAALLGGRRMMHFANCRGHLADASLEQTITAKFVSDRRLGVSENVMVPNEIEFSLSANMGFSYSPDIYSRLRKIELFYAEEDANSRRFPIRDLHGWVRTNRSEILSAIAALVYHWQDKGCPAGPTPFTSFPEWSATVGGIMCAADLGDPCITPPDDAGIGGDLQEKAMRALFLIAYEAYPEQFVQRNEILNLVQDKQDDVEPLDYFGDLSSDGRGSHGNRARLGKLLGQYAGRVLGGVRMIRDVPGDRTARARLKFVKDGSSGPVINIESDSPPPKSSPTGQAANPASTETNPAAPAASSSAPTQNNGRGASQDAPAPRTPPAGQEPGPDDGRVGKFGRFSQRQLCDQKGLLQKENGEVSTPHKEGVGNGYQTYQTCQPAPGRPSLLTRLDDLRPVADAIRTSGAPVALDIETYGSGKEDALDAFRGDIRLLTLAIPGREPWLLDLRKIGYDLKDLAPVLTEAEVVVHNWKFDALFLLAKCGVKLKRAFCTFTASRVLTNGTEAKNGLGDLIRRHFNINLPKDQAKSDWGADQLTDEQLRYAYNDVLYLHRLREVLTQEIEKEHLTNTMTLEMQLLPVVVSMEHRGFAVDRIKLNEMLCAAQEAADEQKGSIRSELNKPEFNPRSVPQVREAFVERGISLVSTGKKTLAACEDPLATELLKFRGAAARSQQARTFLEAIGSDGRIHGNFHPVGTRTGRFSSSQPNVQNASRGVLRTCFTASPGNMLVVADYSQIELRAAAVIGSDPDMLEAFQKGADLHRKTASLVLNKPEAEVTKLDRQLAKAVNFGLLFGQSPNGLVTYAKEKYGVTMTVDRAKSFIRRFFAAYGGLKRWHDDAWKKARRRATEVRTRHGRRRLLTEEVKDWKRFTGLTNTSIQGSCADGMKLALVEVAAKLPPEAFIVSTVHDEMIVETPAEIAEDVLRIVKEGMERAMAKLFPELPIVVDAKVAENWGEK